MAEPKYVSCVRLAEILEDISHDSVNRFLLRERYTPEDLFNEGGGGGGEGGSHVSRGHLECR